MSRESRNSLQWRQLHLALPMSVETATQVVERLVVDAHLGHLVMEARATGGRVRYLLGAKSHQHIDGIIYHLSPGSRTTTLTSSRTLGECSTTAGSTPGQPAAIERAVGGRGSGSSGCHGHHQGRRGAGHPGPRWPALSAHRDHWRDSANRMAGATGVTYSTSRQRDRSTAPRSHCSAPGRSRCPPGCHCCHSIKAAPATAEPARSVAGC